jgi:hypothetical protein
MAVGDLPKPSPPAHIDVLAVLVHRLHAEGCFPPAPVVVILAALAMQSPNGDNIIAAVKIGKKEKPLRFSRFS